MALVAMVGIFTSIGVLDEKTPSSSNGDSSNSAACQHEFKETVLQNGDCVTDRIVQKHCEKCDTIQTVLIPAAGLHTFRDTSKEFIIFDSIYHKVTDGYLCSVCGESKTITNYVEHSFDANNNCVCGYHTDCLHTNSTRGNDIDCSVETNPDEHVWTYELVCDSCGEVCGYEKVSTSHNFENGYCVNCTAPEK